MRYIQLFLGVLVCLVPLCTRAASTLEISEIMYDPAGTDTNREWIEVHTTGDSPLSLANVTLATDGVASTHHALTAVGSSTLGSDAYAVIVQNVDAFKKDYPDYAGLLFDSSWTGLTSSVGKTLALLDSSGTVLDQVTYDPTLGGDNDGNSLQKNDSGAWSAHTPTPGTSFFASTDSTTDTGISDTNTASQNTTTNTNSQITTPVVGHVSPTQKAHLVLTIPKSGITGVPLSLTTQALGDDSSERTIGSFYVSFGDGAADTSSHPRTLSHVYSEAGTYVVVFEYRFDPYAIDPDLVTRTTVEITSPEITLTIGTANTIALANTSSREIDISHWHLSTSGQSQTNFNFVVPLSTKILAGKTIRIAAAVTGFDGTNSNSLQLTLPSGVVVSTLSKNLTSKQVVKTSTAPAVSAGVSSKTKTSTKKGNKKTTKNTTVDDTSEVTNIPVESTQKTNSFIPYILGCVGIIIGASVALVRSKFGKPTTPLDPNEIKIIE